MTKFVCIRVAFITCWILIFFAIGYFLFPVLFQNSKRGSDVVENAVEDDLSVFSFQPRNNDPILYDDAGSQMDQREIDYERTRLILHEISKTLTNKDLILQNTTNQYRAALWIIRDDKMKVDAHDNFFMQRYVLANFYFSTTTPSTTDCQQQVHDWTRYGAIMSTYQTDDNYHCLTSSGHQKKRFLSRSRECDWYGITCNPNGFVSKIVIGEMDLASCM